MTLVDETTRRIVAFIEGVGITVHLEPVAEPAFLPGLMVRGGGIVADPDHLAWPGDLLHEAGHIAVTDPALRPALSEVSHDPAEEMAAIAWSFAAATAIGLPTDAVFHAAGYGDGGGWLIDAFARPGAPGTPMLCYWGMTGWPNDPQPFPHMRRWLR